MTTVRVQRQPLPFPHIPDEVSKQKRQRRLQTTLVSANVILSKSMISLAEDGANGIYTVVLDAAPGTTLNVNIASSSSSEILLSDTSLEFTDANWDTGQTVTVSAIDDREVESLTGVDITHTVDIPNGYSWTGAFSPSSVLTAWVYDNDEAGILISASTVYVNENGYTTYTVGLMGRPSADAVVRYRLDHSWT